MFCVICNTNAVIFNTLGFYSCKCKKIKILRSALVNFNNGLMYCSLFHLYESLFLIYRPKDNSTNRVYFTFDGNEYNNVVTGLLDINSLEYKEAPYAYNFGTMYVLELFETEIKSIEDKIKKNLIFL